jgi:hypothetical protein
MVPFFMYFCESLKQKEDEEVKPVILYILKEILDKMTGYSTPDDLNEE